MVNGDGFKALVLFCVAAFGADLASADSTPSYAATSASITWTFGFYSNETISLTGPALSLTGGAGNYGDLIDAGITPGTPFSFAIPIVNGDEGGGLSGTIGGVSNTDFWISSPDLLTVSGVVFTTATLSPTVSATLTGTIRLCLPASTCYLTGGTQYFNVNVNLPGIVKVSVIDIGTSSNPTYAVYSAQFTSGPAPKCDINGDGRIDITDVQTIVNQVLSGNPPSSSDINGDGAVNVADVQRVVNAVLGLGCVTQ